MSAPNTAPAPFRVLWGDTQAGRAERFVKRKLDEMRLMPPYVKRPPRGSERRA